jgi:hypothetical protein
MSLLEAEQENNMRIVKTLRDDISAVEQRYNKTSCEQTADQRDQMQARMA